MLRGDADWSLLAINGAIGSLPARKLQQQQQQKNQIFIFIRQTLKNTQCPLTLTSPSNLPSTRSCSGKDPYP